MKVIAALGLLGAGLWAAQRVTEARGAGVPLDLAFKHPTASIASLRAVLMRAAMY